MLIGVDETGTVVDGETFIVVVAMIQPSRAQRAFERLRRWETLTRRRLSNPGLEIKSTSLDEKARREFVNKVLWPPSSGITFFCVATDVDERVLAWGAAQRDRYVAGLEQAEASARQRGGVKLANYLKNLTGSYRKMPAGMSIKQQTLGIAVAKALNVSIRTSVVGGFDDELSQLRCSIDQGFTRGGAERWRFMLRNHLMQSTQIDPPTFPATWGPHHPFIATFIDAERGEYVRLKPEFGERFDFCDSGDTPEVRIADIVAGLTRSKVINRSRARWDDRAWEREVGDGVAWLDFTHSEDFAPEVETGLSDLYERWAELEDPRGTEG